MEKEFVPYELAVKLKELGFDEPCFGFWCKDTKTQEYTIRNGFDKSSESIKGRNFQAFLSAPTFSQAFRWFRKKNFICHVTNDLSNNLQDEVYVYVMTKGYGSLIDRSEEYSTYEEAELACLKKLIEIVKTK